MLRDWRNTVETVLFEISSSIKTHPSGFHAYTSKFRPMTGLVEPTNLDEASNRIPPTSQMLWLERMGVASVSCAMLQDRAAVKLQGNQCAIC